jgi:hypothetical protein
MVWQPFASRSSGCFALSTLVFSWYDVHCGGPPGIIAAVSIAGDGSDEA